MSFEPISNPDTSILILGSLPGDKSLELGEYYGHPRNRFWKIISAITNSELPLTYPNKKALLLHATIGLWDVAHKANRAGSLDSAIKDAEPNDLEGFLKRHRKIRVIAFNGAKAQALYDKYFDRKAEINYITLPSSSPANAGIDFENLCRKWSAIIADFT
jgi:hypoxanthine-DNA glycosylase